jgi:hypothetical protein
MILLVTDGESYDLHNGADAEIVKELQDAGSRCSA